MAISVKKAMLWRRELENRPGTLAEALLPFSAAKVNLKVVMGYVYPGDRSRAALEVYPVAGKKAEAAASAGGLSPAAAVHCVVAEGDDEVGLANRIAEGLNQAGINISFAIFQVVNEVFVGVLGFDSEQSATRALAVIKSAGKAKAKAAASKKARGKAKGRATKKPASKKGAARKTAAKKAAVRPARKTAAKKAPAKKKAPGKPSARKAKPAARKKK